MNQISQESLDLLTKTILGNIIKNPTEIKFQKLSKTNIKLQKHLTKEFINLLLEAGFEEHDTQFVFKGDTDKISLYIKEFETRYQNKDKKQEKKLEPEKLADSLLEFILNTASGQLSGLFRFYGTSLKDLTNRGNVLKLSTANYFNTCYKSIILKDDPYVVEWYNKFWMYCDHSPVCLTHILFQLVCYVQEQVDYQILDYSSLDKFRSSSKEQIQLITFILKKEVIKLVNHECHGEKLEDLDPNVPLFITEEK